MINCNSAKSGDICGAQFSIELFAERGLNKDAAKKNWWEHIASPKIKADIEKYSKYSDVTKDFLDQFATQCMDNPQLTLDFFSSLNSPYNVDKSTITDATPEGKKFNEVYDSLTKSLEFKRLFLDIFDENKTRFNVKFEIADHVYDHNDPTKEVNGNTTYDGTPNLVITISKQILATGTAMSKTRIEIAKTILHECIHAYLYVKKNNPNLGMDIADVVKAQYPTYSEQHEFMYDHMLPIMIRVFSDMRNAVTSPAGRAAVEGLNMHPTTTPVLTSEPWNWNKYFKFLSLKGLEGTPCFQQDFPNPEPDSSNEFRFFNFYVNQGHNYLDMP
ncbi:MAG: SprT-like domain-containing protein [Flavobacterium sp.]